MGALDFMQSKERTHQAISPLKDPFTKDCIREIHISIYSNRSYGLPMNCRVEFTNGKTTGTQRFEGQELGPMMTEVQAFIDSLKK